MRNALLAFAAALSLTAGSAQAQQCLDWPVALSAARSKSPDAALLRLIEGQPARDLIRVVNSLPPVSAFEGDQVALLHRPSDDSFLIVIGGRDCAAYVVELPTSIFATMLGEEI